MGVQAMGSLAWKWQPRNTCAVYLCDPRSGLTGFDILLPVESNKVIVLSCFYRGQRDSPKLTGQRRENKREEKNKTKQNRRSRAEIALNAEHHVCTSVKHALSSSALCTLRLLA